MKKLISILLSLLFIAFATVLPVNAIGESDNARISRHIEYLDDGSYYVIEIEQSQMLVRSNTTSGSKSAVYYGADGTAIWRIVVSGTFSYTPGISAKATSASATVGLIADHTTFVEKNAYTSGASAYGYGKVKYRSSLVEKTVTLTCDKYGNLS